MSDSSGSLEAKTAAVTALYLGASKAITAIKAASEDHGPLGERARILLGRLEDEARQE
ncbi:MAG: hypothetical protein AAF628_31975 [Planctomycetota bacterium]